ncbi:COG3650 family protein [Desulfovibrio sp. Fe33]|uniref:COG3650 family protein n=1 Tax=Desulfovibrio sp. Fe33 TaxID=3020842 RepID=UPI00234D1304|nr:hypothetical protein [Desulfovibrio sp. Fe33]
MSKIACIDTFSRSFLFPLAAFILLAAGCSAPSGGPGNELSTHDDSAGKALHGKQSGKSLENLKTFRGLLAVRSEGYFLTLCGTQKALPVLDETAGELQAAMKLFAPDSKEPVFTELLGTSTPSSDALTARELLHASAVGESWGCRERFGEFSFKAMGNEPGWIMKAAPGELSLTTMDSPSPRRFSGVTSAQSGEDAVFTGEDVSLTLTRGVCMDTMSGEQFGWRAEAVVDGTTYRGCAVRGDL